ncbi:MAG TPA: hypothetical protein VL096_02170 [Pirellulaceae bacterium]|nr:hypothetical protein [Pirellulaceae bacterium]
MKTTRCWAIVLALMLVMTLPALAAAEGWGLPGWNPFASKSNTSKAKSPANKSVRASVSDDDGFSLTSKKPGSSYNSSRKPTTEPSTWSKFTSGTSSTMKKTGSYLTPWRKETPPPPKPSGSRGIKTSAKQASNRGESGTTWYNPTTWFGSGEPAPKKIDSVPGFLGQSRPSY